MNKNTTKQYCTIGHMLCSFRLIACFEFRTCD